MRDELDELRETNRQLREALVPASGRVNYGTFAPTRTERAILDALRAAPGFLSEDDLRCRVDVALNRTEPSGLNTIPTAICRLRTRLIALDPPIGIGTERGWGYYLTRENKSRLEALAG